ncbi:hypothetical protein FACS1894125_0080 [Actinomycetota bacterium]|nr:hypothetical protein FACS1894125_0080 [Actinomycetota bacterium]
MVSNNQALAAPDVDPLNVASSELIYDGTHPTAENPSAKECFINTANGYAIGDNSSKDGVVCTGDLVAYKVTLQFKAGPERDVHFKTVTTNNNLLDYGIPNLCKQSKPIITIDPDHNTDTDCVFHIKAGAVYSVKAIITLKADSNNLDKVDSSVSFEFGRNADGSAITYEMPAITVVGAPLADLTTGCQAAYRAVLNGSEYKGYPGCQEYRYPYPANDPDLITHSQDSNGAGQIVITPKQLKPKAEYYDQSRDLEDDDIANGSNQVGVIPAKNLTWKTDIDVTDFPWGATTAEQTTFALNGAALTVVEITVDSETKRYLKTAGGQPLTGVGNRTLTYQLPAGSFPTGPDGSGVDPKAYSLQLLPLPDSFKVNETLNNSDGSAPGNNNGANSSTSNANTSAIAGGIGYANNNWARQVFVYRAPIIPKVCGQTTDNGFVCGVSSFSVKAPNNNPNDSIFAQANRDWTLGTGERIVGYYTSTESTYANKITPETDLTLSLTIRTTAYAPKGTVAAANTATCQANNAGNQTAIDECIALANKPPAIPDMVGCVFPQQNASASNYATMSIDPSKPVLVNIPLGYKVEYWTGNPDDGTGMGSTPTTDQCYSPTAKSGWAVAVDGKIPAAYSKTTAVRVIIDAEYVDTNVITVPMKSDSSTIRNTLDLNYNIMTGVGGNIEAGLSSTTDGNSTKYIFERYPFDRTGQISLKAEKETIDSNELNTYTIDARVNNIESNTEKFITRYTIELDKCADPGSFQLTNTSWVLDTSAGSGFEDPIVDTATPGNPCGSTNPNARGAIIHLMQVDSTLAEAPSAILTFEDGSTIILSDAPQFKLRHYYRALASNTYSPVTKVTMHLFDETGTVEFLAPCDTATNPGCTPTNITPAQISDKVVLVNSVNAISGDAYFSDVKGNELPSPLTIDYMQPFQLSYMLGNSQDQVYQVIDLHNSQDANNVLLITGINVRNDTTAGSKLECSTNGTTWQDCTPNASGFDSTTYGYSTYLRASTPVGSSGGIVFIDINFQPTKMNITDYNTTGNHSADREDKAFNITYSDFMDMTFTVVDSSLGHQLNNLAQYVHSNITGYVYKDNNDNSRYDEDSDIFDVKLKDEFIEIWLSSATNDEMADGCSTIWGPFADTTTDPKVDPNAKCYWRGKTTNTNAVEGYNFVSGPLPSGDFKVRVINDKSIAGYEENITDQYEEPQTLVFTQIGNLIENFDGSYIQDKAGVAGTSRGISAFIPISVNQAAIKAGSFGAIFGLKMPEPDVRLDSLPAQVVSDDLTSTTVDFETVINNDSNQTIDEGQITYRIPKDMQPEDLNIEAAFSSVGLMPSDLKYVVASSFNAYAITTTGNLYAWAVAVGNYVPRGTGTGANGTCDMTLSTSTCTDSEVGALAQQPRQVATNIASVAASDSNVYAITGTGTLYTWATSTANYVPKATGVTGSLGSCDMTLSTSTCTDSETTVAATQPRQIATGVSSVAASAGNAYAITSTGSLYAWTSNNTTTYVPRGTGTGSLGGCDMTLSTSTCTASENGAPAQQPRQIATGVSSVAASAGNAYAITAFGAKLFAWVTNTTNYVPKGTGTGSNGACDMTLSTSTCTASEVNAVAQQPRQIAKGIASIVASGSTAYAITTLGGKLFAWSTNASYYVPRGTGTGSNGACDMTLSTSTCTASENATLANQPRRIATGIALVVASGSNTYAISTLGNLYAWSAIATTTYYIPKGTGTGVNGTCDMTASPSTCTGYEGGIPARQPRQIATDMLSVATSDYNVYATQSSGVVYSWSVSDVGYTTPSSNIKQCNMNQSPSSCTTSERSSLPRQISVNIASVAASDMSAYALTTTGTLYAWSQVNNNHFIPKGTGTGSLGGCDMTASPSTCTDSEGNGGIISQPSHQPRRIATGIASVVASSNIVYAITTTGSNLYAWTTHATAGYVPKGTGTGSLGTCDIATSTCTASENGPAAQQPRQIATGIVSVVASNVNSYAITSAGNNLFAWATDGSHTVPRGTGTGSLGTCDIATSTCTAYESSTAAQQPRQIATGIVSVAASSANAYAITSTGGNLYAWSTYPVTASYVPKGTGTGVNGTCDMTLTPSTCTSYENLGLAQQPRQIATGIASVVAASNDSYAITATGGKLFTWANNDSAWIPKGTGTGYLGTCDMTLATSTCTGHEAGAPARQPRQIATGIASVVANGFSAATTSSGDLYAWATYIIDSTFGDFVPRGATGTGSLGGCDMTAFPSTCTNYDDGEILATQPRQIATGIASVTLGTGNAYAKTTSDKVYTWWIYNTTSYAPTGTTGPCDLSQSSCTAPVASYLPIQISSNINPGETLKKLAPSAANAMLIDTFDTSNANYNQFTLDIPVASQTVSTVKLRATIRKNPAMYTPPWTAGADKTIGVQAYFSSKETPVYPLLKKCTFEGKTDLWNTDPNCVAAFVAPLSLTPLSAGLPLHPSGFPIAAPVENLELKDIEQKYTDTGTTYDTEGVSSTTQASATCSTNADTPAPTVDLNITTVNGEAKFIDPEDLCDFIPFKVMGMAANFATISGTVFDDTNGGVDGTANVVSTTGDAKPLAGVQVNLSSEDESTWYPSTTTDANGKYSFQVDLGVGYKVWVGVNTSYALTPQFKHGSPASTFDINALGANCPTAPVAYCNVFSSTANRGTFSALIPAGYVTDQADINDINLGVEDQNVSIQYWDGWSKADPAYSTADCAMTTLLDDLVRAVGTKTCAPAGIKNTTSGTSFNLGAKLNMSLTDADLTAFTNGGADMLTGQDIPILTRDTLDLDTLDLDASSNPTPTARPNNTKRFGWRIPDSKSPSEVTVIITHRDGSITSEYSSPGVNYLIPATAVHIDLIFNYEPIPQTLTFINQNGTLPAANTETGWDATSWPTTLSDAANDNYHQAIGTYDQTRAIDTYPEVPITLTNGNYPTTTLDNGDPTRTGYIFAGWRVIEDTSDSGALVGKIFKSGAAGNFDNGDPCTVVAPCSIFSMPLGNVTLTDAWGTKEPRIHFANGFGDPLYLAGTYTPPWHNDQDDINTGTSGVFYNKETPTTLLQSDFSATPLTPTTAEVGKALDFPAAMTISFDSTRHQDAYVFDCWYSSLTKKCLMPGVSTDVLPANDVEDIYYTARWAGGQNVIYNPGIGDWFDPNGVPNDPGSPRVNKDDWYPISDSVPEKPGYTFIGYDFVHDTVVDGNTYSYNPVCATNVGGVNDNTAGDIAGTLCGFYMPEGSVHLVARFKANDYDVFFDVNAYSNGVDVNGNPILVPDVSAKAQQPNLLGLDWDAEYSKDLPLLDASRPGYRFAGWYYDSSACQDADSNVEQLIDSQCFGIETGFSKPAHYFDIVNTANGFDNTTSSYIVLYAKWAPIDYSFTFIPDVHERKSEHLNLGDGVYCFVGSKWVHSSSADCSAAIDREWLTITGSGDRIKYHFEHFHWDSALQAFEQLFESPQYEVLTPDTGYNHKHEGIYFDDPNGGSFSTSSRIPEQWTSISTQKPNYFIASLLGFDPDKSQSHPLPTCSWDDDICWNTQPLATTGISAFDAFYSDLVPESSIAQHSNLLDVSDGRALDAIATDQTFYGRTVPDFVDNRQPPPPPGPTPAAGSGHLSSTGVQLPLYALVILMLLSMCARRLERHGRHGRH